MSNSNPQPQDTALPEQAEQVTAEVKEKIDLPPPAPEEEITKDSNLDSYRILNNAYIFVMNGVHEGATFNISDEITIGKSFDNDMILTDEGIEDKHITLKPHETQFGFGIQITCNGETVTLNAEDTLKKDQTLLLEDNFVLTLADISLNIHINRAGLWKTTYKKFLAPQINVAKEYKEEFAETISPKNILSDKRHIAITVMGVILFICMATLIYMLIPAQKKALMKSNTNIKSLSIRDQVTQTSLAQQALSDLNRTLNHYKLTGRVTTYIQDRTIYIKGRINNYENKLWIQVQNWYDSTYGATINLVSLLEVHNGLRRTISFRAVVTDGRMPYVVSWTGERYRPGATLPGGWIVEDINDTGVLVRDTIENRLFVVEHIRSRRGPEVEELTLKRP